MVLMKGPEQRLTEEADIPAEGSSYRRRCSPVDVDPEGRRVASSCEVITTTRCEEAARHAAVT